MEVITKDVAGNRLIELDIIFPTGFINQFSVADTWRVISLKKVIRERFGYSEESQTIRFHEGEVGNGMVLDNNSRFIDYGFRGFVELELEVPGTVLGEQKFKRKYSPKEAITDKALIKKQKTESLESKAAIDESSDSSTPPMTEDERLLSLLGASVDIDRDGVDDPEPEYGFPTHGQSDNQIVAKRAKLANVKSEFGPAIKPETTDKPVKTEVSNPHSTMVPTPARTAPPKHTVNIQPTINDFIISETANQLSDASTLLALATNSFCKAFTRKISIANRVDLATRQISAATHARNVALIELKKAVRELQPIAIEMKEALEIVDEPVQGLRKLLKRVGEEGEGDL